MARRDLARLFPAMVTALSAAACASVERPAAQGRAVIPATISSPAAVRSNTPIPNPPERSTSRPVGTSSSVAQALGRYKVGKPYQVAGVWYVPAEQPGYDAVGTASWYGEAFHGKATANGEAFDMHLASAAHATLPLPCIVEVTNLENDRSVQVRVNDRGPFKPGRIIDVSRQAADQLGFIRQGTAKVRVRYVGPAPLDPFLPPPDRKRPSLLAVAPAIINPERGADLERAAAIKAPPVQTAPRFAVQAGSFANKGNAERAAKTLGSIAPTEVRELEREGGVLYRVLVGVWPARDEASGALAQVAEAGFPDAKVVTSS
jgi:rare lipoprotein A